MDYEGIDQWVEVKKPLLDYHSYNIANEITYKIIGCCFEVHNELGKGFSEVVYKDALEYEFKEKNIPYGREKKFEIKYKDIVLPHYYIADFIVENNIVLEVKAQQTLVSENTKQVLNYLAASNGEVGLLINFGESSLKYKRIVLTK